MEKCVEKYREQIEDELFKATPDETIDFVDKLIKFLLELKVKVIEEQNFDKDKN